MSRPSARTAALALLVFGLFASSGCAKRPPDTDAIPAGANALALDTPRGDVLDCRVDDCADWFSVLVPEKGKLVIDMTATPAKADDVRISLSLTDGRGATLARDQTVGRTAISVFADVAPATYLIAIASNHPTARFDYSVTARLVPPPPVQTVVPRKKKPGPALVKPAPARFETKRAQVLEVDENGPHGRAVLLDAGSAQGLRVGMRGRLLDGGRAIAALEIVELYPEGCLARVDGASAPIGATSTAEIEVPLAP